MSRNLNKEVTEQSAIIKSIPILITAALAIISIVSTCNLSKDQMAQNQINFKRQFERDSILNIKQDSVTSNQLELAKYQLMVTNKQYLVDSLIKAKEILISTKEYDLYEKQNEESDIITKENLAVSKISFVTYKTILQNGNLDSLFGYTPDIINDQNDDKVDEFRLIQCLTLYNLAKDSILSNIPIFYTLSDAQKYINYQKIHRDISEFEPYKKYTFQIEVTNKTKFPIKLLSSSTMLIDYPYSKDSLTKDKSTFFTNRIIYPGDKFHIEGRNILTPITQVLNKKLNFELNLKYQTIYGIHKKNVRFQYNEEDGFIIYD